MTERRYKLEWRRMKIAGEESHHDFTAFDGDRQVARIYLTRGGHIGQGWRWAMQAMFGNRICSSSGTESERDAAIRLVEAHYERSSSDSPLDACCSSAMVVADHHGGLSRR
jgi:uncharacterized membrane-anchored protein